MSMISQKLPATRLGESWTHHFLIKNNKEYNSETRDILVSTRQNFILNYLLAPPL
jgi:hypothetical protein